MTDDLFSREEALAGPVGRRASRLLLTIEIRSSYMIALTRRAIWRILSGRKVNTDTPNQDSYDVFEAIQVSADPQYRPLIQDLEAFAQHWMEVIPDDPRIRAALAHQLGQKYQFAYDDVPNIRAALGLDDEAVHDAHRDLYKDALGYVFARETPRDDRPFWSQTPDWLGPDVLRELVDDLEWIHVKWGQTLFEQDDQGDSLFVIVNGRLRMITTTAEGNEIVLGESGRGEIIGEMALLTEETRIATALAIRDTEVVRLSKAGFDKLVRSSSGAMTHLTREMVNRFRRSTEKEFKQPRASTIALIPASEDVPIEEVTNRLVTALNRLGSAMKMDINVVGEMVARSLSESGSGPANESRILWWLNEHETRYQFIVYQGEPEMSPWTRRCLSQADRILVVGMGDNSADLGEVEQRLYGPEIDRIATRRDLILIHPNRDSRPRGTGEWKVRRNIREHYHVCLDRDADFLRLARFLTGKALGLALGGGGARGFAHVGAIRALEEEGLVIDYMGGTSFGAIVGATYAYGYTSEELTDIFKEFARNYRSYFDVTLPIVAFIKGDRLNKLYQQYFGDTRIEDLWLNFFCVSANLTRAQMMIHDEGELWRYVRASSSIPTIFPPLQDPGSGDLLLDGGIFNNLPADLMVERIDGGRVVAHNVSPREDMKGNYQVGDSIGGLQVLMGRIPFAKPVVAPNLMSIVTRTMILGSTRDWVQQASHADLLIDSNIGQYEILDFDAYDDIVQIGYEKTKQAVARWKRDENRMKELQTSGSLRIKG